MANEQEINPELLLIDLIVDQIEDDEKIIEGLGRGTWSLADLERWRRRREESEKRFLEESARLIDRMRRDGFDRNMRHSTIIEGIGQASAHPPAPRHGDTATPPPESAGRFALDLKDLGLPCSLKLQGDYEEVLAAGLWHARRAHRLEGSADSLREVVRSAMVECLTTRQAPEESAHFRTEEQVSDEAANQTRTRPWAA